MHLFHRNFLPRNNGIYHPSTDSHAIHESKWDATSAMCQKLFFNSVIIYTQSTSPNMPCHTLCRNQRLPPHTDNQFPIQVPPLRRISHSSSMHIPEPSALMLIVKTSCDFSVGEEEVFGPWLAIEREGWVGAVMEDVEAGLAEVGGDVVDPSGWFLETLVLFW